ncbi:mitochondrial/chloroplast ribosomal protein L54/L37 [Sparassis latifolia]|uniref:Large ribosomal subunit protein mL54 n=1 Tax=Sparassis crispa TaxID=139825 RepID=A0A401GI09_9APHY|nr:54S ribosomal protein L37, mitochondrial [Sparassis crispa]GBE81830.1 54S ribosomal protein L37, mitochondrial [Sparassis crispa]
MSLLHALRRPPRLNICCVVRRAYTSKGEAPKNVGMKAETPVDGEESPAGTFSKSSCEPNTILDGLAYLKDQPPVIALPDEEYPEWLWTLLSPKVLEDDGPGGKAEKRRMRQENRKRIRDQNFMKTQ